MDKTDLLTELHSPAAKMSGLGALKTRYRPLVCPLTLVLEQIPMGAHLFDIGCGSGSLMFLALRLRGAALAHGYDVSQDAITAAKAFATVPNFCATQLPTSQTPPSLTGYDTITMVDVLHHLPLAAQTAFLDRVYEQMDPGAKLIVLDINADRSIQAFCNQMHDLLLSRQWVHPMRPGIVFRTFLRFGARVAAPVLVNTLWYSHYLIVVEKP